jgi:methyl-accepting chemotaxis protein
MNWFDNLRIVVKVALAPLMGVICIVFIGIGAHQTLDHMDRLFSRLDEEAFGRFAQATRLERDALALYADLFRVNSMAAANGAGPHLEGDAAQLGQRARTLAATAVEPSLAPDLKDFAAAAQETIKFVTVDASSTFIMMSNTETAFQALSARLADATLAADTRRGEIFASARDAGRDATRLFAIAMALFLAGGLVATLLTARAVARPVVAMTRTMSLLAEGDSEVPVEGTSRRDELGAMARAVEVFKDNKRRAIALERSQQAEQTAKESRAIALEQQAARFEADMAGTLVSVSEAATRMRATAETMLAMAEQNTAQSGMVSDAARLTADNVTAVAAGAEQLSASFQEIGRQVAHSSAIARDAAQESREVSAIVASLAEAAGRIGQVVEMISAIASQTNLLALNATKFRSIKQVQSSPCRTPLSLAA